MGNNRLNTTETNITTFPGHGPAHRVLTSRTATSEQVRAARDLLWAEPGDEPQRVAPISRFERLYWLESGCAVFTLGWVAGLVTVLLNLR